MMKNAYKFLGYFAFLGVIIFASSCGDDDGGIDIGDGAGTFSVSDGVYIAGISGTDVSVSTAAVLNSNMVEGPDFGTIERSGHLVGYVYLTAGNYVFAEIDEQEILNQWGGTATTTDGSMTLSGAETSEQPSEFVVVSLSENGAAFAVGTEGVYHVVFDTQSSEALLTRVTSWGVIGGAVFESACVSNGFNSDVDVVESSSSADGTTWESSGIILKGGEYKIRFNDAWKIDRRTMVDDNDPYNAANGYVALTNLGGTLSALEEGGSNITLADADAGTYTVTVSLSDAGVISLAIERTGDAEVCAFDIENFTWGIIGGATFDDWNTDQELTYANGDGGVHKWRGVFPLDAGGDGNNQFKFRTDDTWATKLLPTNVNVTDNTDAGTISDDGATNADGQWFLADGNSGLYYFEVTTDDFGVTWNMTIDEAAFEVIGAATPGGWDTGTVMTYNDDLASATVTGIALTADEYKFRVNAGWDYNLGGALTDLVFNGGNITATAGTFDITITTADGGVTYTATVQ